MLVCVNVLQYITVCSLVPQMAELYRGGVAPDLIAMKKRQLQAAAARRLAAKAVGVAETVRLERAQPRRAIIAAAAKAAAAARIADSAAAIADAETLAKVQQWDNLHDAMQRDELPAHFVRFTR